MSTATYRRVASTADASSEDFSLVLGGPLFQLMRRARLSDDALGLLHRRLVVAVLIMWAPLAALSALTGGAGGAARFLNDIGQHVRFLVAAPLLIAAEPIVHRRLRALVDQFQTRGLVRTDQSQRFADALSDASRWRDSVAAELLMFVGVYAVGVLFTLRRYVALGGNGWYAAPSGAGLSSAGAWLVFVSLPLMQFLLLRWYYRLILWTWLLWRVSRLDLDLNATHPDKACGLGFLSDSLNAFVPIAMAHGALFAGMMAELIFYAGARFTDFQVEVLGGAVFLFVVFAGPLTLFSPSLARAKRAGLLVYGALAQTYVREFRDKWLGAREPHDEPVIGSGDIQSLADLGNSFGAAEQTRLTPIHPKGLIYFVGAFLAPIAPLALTMTSMEKLIGRLMGLVF